jgi:putative ribosome biogenesis GTPase RsgA
LHLNEPKCVIKEKVKELKIAESRYQNYVNMINDEDLKYR